MSFSVKFETIRPFRENAELNPAPETSVVLCVAHDLDDRSWQLNV